MKHAHSQQMTNGTQFLGVFFNSLLWYGGPRTLHTLWLANTSISCSHLLLLVKNIDMRRWNTCINSLLFYILSSKVYWPLYCLLDVLSFMGDEMEHSIAFCFSFVIEYSLYRARRTRTSTKSHTHTTRFLMKLDQLIRIELLLSSRFKQFSHIKYLLWQLALLLGPHRKS